MPKIFLTYCALLVMVLAIANRQGYVLTSLFSDTHEADKTVNLHHK
jgi:hypothetical protein